MKSKSSDPKMSKMAKQLKQQIAIVGIGCRYSGGVDGVEKFWDMLSQGLDCTTPPPSDRFDCNFYHSPGEKLPGKIYSERGGFLQQDPYMFDRKFFKISPDEADHLDPQVRLLLEVTWEALEDAGIPASSVRGSQTGVYMGVTASEYAILASMPSHNMNRYTNSGTNSCMMSNRVSYEFDFRGPSFSIDTACSSSLYAIQMACDGLKSGSCEMAVAGGVNLVLMAGATVGFCQAGMLSSDGRSKSFDDSANGYARSEGAGVIVLKLLSKAIEDGDRIYAVIRGGALSNDGRTNGIATPSLDAQKNLIKSACRNAGIDPRDVVYAEAHGTGTIVGDRTEANALGQVICGIRKGDVESPPELGDSVKSNVIHAEDDKYHIDDASDALKNQGVHQGDAKSPHLFIGSVKSNIGHTEGAAGVAGIIKTALSIQRRCIPSVVHFNTPNKMINVEELNICFPKTSTPWPKERPLVATCSSFGFGGANANLVLTGPSDDGSSSDATCDYWKAKPLLLSAASKEALVQRLKDWELFLQNIAKKDEKTFISVLYMAAQRSHHHQHRLGIIVSSLEDAIQQVKLRLAEDKTASCMEDVISSNQPNNKIVFVFSGMGTQWWGMARDLMQSSEVFASKIQDIDEILHKYGAKWSLVNMLTEEHDKEKINKTDIAQPCICAVQIGLLAVWKQKGVVPDVVVGHSVGEVAAAYAAGLLELESAVELVYHRGKLLSKTSGSGKMLAVLHAVDEIQDRFQQCSCVDVLDIAAENSPNQIVFSGCNSDIDHFADYLKRDRIKCVRLKVDNAFHSRQQDSIKESFIEKVSKIKDLENAGKTSPRSTIPMMSSVTCKYVTTQEVGTSEYWWSNTRNKVRFKEAIEELISDGCGVFVEVGAHAALRVAIEDTAENMKKKSPRKIITTASLLRPQDTKTIPNDTKDLLLSHVKLHVAGVSSTFESYFEESCRNVTSIPLYPWQREKCSAVSETALELFQFPANNHPLLGERQVSFIAQTAMEKVWKSELNESMVPWLKDHVIGGAVILPAAAYLEVALAVAKEEFPDDQQVTLSNVDLQKFLFASSNKAILETTLDEVQGKLMRVTIRSHDGEAKKWMQHGCINISIPQFAELDSEPHWLDVGNVLERCKFPIGKEEFYANESSVGLSLGPSFRSTTKAFVNGEYTEIICYCEAPENVSWDAYRYSFHPAFLDSCFQPFAVLLFAQGREAAANLGTLHRPLKRVPRFINKFYLNRNAPRNVIVHLVSTGGKGDDRSCDVKVADAETGEIFCVIDGMKFEVFESEGISMDPHIWKTDWVHVPLKGESVDDLETAVNDEPDEDNEGNHSVCIESDIDILDRKFLVFPDQGGVSQMVTTALTTLGIHIEVVGIEENPKEAIDQHFASGGSSFTDILVFRTLDIKGIADVGDASVPLSLEDFQRIENPAPMFCIGILQRVLEIEQDCRPRVVFVSKGAYDVDIPGCQQNGYSEGAATRCHDVTNGQPIYDTPTRTTVYENSNRTSTWPYGMPNGTPLYENVSRTPLDGTPNGSPRLEEGNQPHAATHLLEIEQGQQITEPINTSTSEPGTSGVFPDPFLSSIHSILITAVHEEPSLRSLILDLPLGSSIQDTTQILHTVLLHLPPDENILSCRYVQPDHTVINEWKLFSPRLRSQSTSKVKVQTSNDQWKVCYDEATGHGKLNMSNSLLDMPKKDNEDVCIRVTAFRSFPPLDQFQTEIVIIYAGVVENSMNANNNQSQERPQRPIRESCVIGITQCSEIPSRLVVKRNLITSIPEGLSCAQAVSLVSRFLPAKVVFDDVFYISTSTNILFLGNKSRMCQAALTILAGMKGVKIIVVLSSTEDDHKPVDGVTYVMSEHIDDLTDSSFDYMIISELTSTLPPGAMLLLLRKLKRRGTVISLQGDNAIASSKYLHNLPSRIKFMSLDMSFPLALEGFSSLEMKALMDEFWKTLTPSVIESSTDDDIKLVSSLPLTNGILPDDAVVDMEGNFTLPFNLQSDTWLADDNVSYLVTGGTSGLGLALVEWLALRKAKHIFVMSRSPPYFEAEETFSRLALQGVNIAHLQGDVTDADLLEELLSNIQNSATKPHLGGIFHFATTYDDGFIHGMTDTSWNAPMSVKAYGTLLLHQLTLKLGITLKYFVVASSVVSVFGNAGQANYCAANNFVNGLCRMRNSMGLPATSLIIGYLNTVGFAVRRGLITAAEENGFISVSPTDVLGALSVALKNNTPELIIAGPLSMGLFASRHRALMTEHFRQTQGTISLLKTLYNDKEAVMGHSNGSLRQLILDLPIEEARKVILTALSNILSKQLGVESDLQDDSSPVLFGVDSMIASSLSQAVSEQFEVTLGAVDFLNESNTLQSISNKILQKILRSVDEDPDPDPDPESLSVQVEEISTNVPSNDIAVPEVTSTSRWIVEGPPLQSPILRIVCFPPNGGGPSTFAAWPHYLTHFGIQLLFVQMPGWEGRDNEIPLATLEEMTQCLTNVLLQVLGETPFVFFGHSMGSLLAFEVTQSLLQHGYCPQHMFLSSWYAPTEDYPQPEELDVPGPVFQKLGQMLGINITKFQQIMEQENVFFSFIDDVVLNNRALMERMLPAVEVAMKIAKAYHLSREELLPCGITVFGGDNDPFVKPELLEDWRLQIEDDTNFDMFLFPGKHMYILDNTDAVLQKITQVLLEQGIALRMPQDGRFGGSLRMTADGGYQEGESDKQPVRLRERKGRATARAPAPVYESSCQTVHKEDEEVNPVAFQTVHKEGDAVNPVVFQTVATVHQEDEDVNLVALIEEDWEELL